MMCRQFYCVLCKRLSEYEVAIQSCYHSAGIEWYQPNVLR